MYTFIHWYEFLGWCDVWLHTFGWMNSYNFVNSYIHCWTNPGGTLLCSAWLGIMIFGSNFWDLHCKQNSDSVFDSGDSGRKFFWILLLKNWQIGIPILKFGIPKTINEGTQYTSFRTRKTVTTIPTSTQHRLPPYLHLLNACPAIPTSTQRPSCHTYIYSTPVAAIPTSTQKKGGNVFRFMKSKESMTWEDSKPAGTCSKLVGTHFTIEKIKIRWKFRSSKGPESE